MTAYRSLTLQSGTFSQIQDGDTLVPGAGIDRATAAVLEIGILNASGISIGKIGALTTVLGDFQVNGVETFVGGATFQNDATFEGNVTFGNAATDTVAFVSGVGTAGNPNFHFIKELAHTIDVNASTTLSAAGGDLTVRPGAGSVASGATAGAQGGTLYVRAGTGGAAAAGAGAAGAGGSTEWKGGTGGAGSVTGAANNGGNVTFTGGDAGADGGAGGGSGGNLDLRGGLATGAGTNGAINVGFTVTSLIRIGAAAVTTTALGGTTSVSAGSTLNTLTSGNIDLPNRAAARFKIETVAVGATVTAPNLDTLTNASNADALHFHTTGGATNVTFATVAAEAILSGAPLVVKANGGATAVANGDADGAGLRTVIGFAAGAQATPGNAISVNTNGRQVIPDASWDVIPVVGDLGSKVFLSETVGKVTLTAPVTSGSTVIRLGFVQDFGSGTSAIVIAIGDGVTL